MHTANYHRVNNFLNRLYDLIENFGRRRPRIGDWYLTAWDYDNRCYDGVYVVEAVSGDWVTTRYCGTFDGYRSNHAQTLKISVLQTCYRFVVPEKITAKSK